MQKHLSVYDWSFSLPSGSGMETYFAHAGGQRYFVKVGADSERYLAMTEIGLTPPVVTSGNLEDGLPIIVQSFIAGRTPSRRDYQEQLEKVATLIHRMHNLPQSKVVLQSATSDLHREAGLQALSCLRQKWESHKAQIPGVAAFVEESLDNIAKEINLFSTTGLVASHNDICNANWLFTSDGKIYLVDFDSMSLDDPAMDMGALLWWYYPPELRRRFLDIAGYRYDHEFKLRMQVRMAMHCLNITLPRDQSFDRFDPPNYEETLEDFRAILAGKENPQGYN